MRSSGGCHGDAGFVDEQPTALLLGYGQVNGQVTVDTGREGIKQRQVLLWVHVSAQVYSNARTPRTNPGEEAGLGGEATPPPLIGQKRRG